MHKMPVIEQPGVETFQHLKLRFKKVKTLAAAIIFGI